MAADAVLLEEGLHIALIHFHISRELLAVELLAVELFDAELVGLEAGSLDALETAMSDSFNLAGAEVASC